VKKKIAIEEVDSSVKAEPEKKVKKKIAIEEVNSGSQEASSSKPVPTVKVDSETKAAASASSSPTKSSPVTIPAGLFKKAKAPPKTGYEFERTLEGCKTASEAAAYMSLVAPKAVPKLLRQNLTSDMLMEMMGGVESGLEGGATAGLKWMQALPKVNRFDIIVDFLSDGEKSRVGKALDGLVAQGADAEGAAKLRADFKL